MKKLLLILSVVALLIPTSAKSEQFRRKGDNVKVVGYDIDFNTSSEGKIADVGSEKVYLSDGLQSASFKKDRVHKFQHNLYYSCMACNAHKKRPGKCLCGMELVPSFKHGKVWHVIGRDADGMLLIDPAKTCVNCTGRPGCGTRSGTCPNFKSCSGDCGDNCAGNCTDCSQ